MQEAGKGRTVTPPAAGADGNHAPLPLRVMRKRAEFLRAARGRRVHGSGFLLQAHPPEGGGEEAAGPVPIDVGFTASKRVGNAVRRNRAKRRLRALAREVLPVHGRSGWAYVLIAKAGSTESLPFLALRKDLVRALRKAHRSPERQRWRQRPGRRSKSGKEGRGEDR